MLPADVIAEITTNLAAIPLESNLAAQVLAAVLAPLLRSSGSPEELELQGKPKPVTSCANTGGAHAVQWSLPG